MKKNAHFLFLAIILFSLVTPRLGQAKSFPVTITNLRTCSMTNPVGLDQTPLFSWELSSSSQDVVQTSYEITVYLDEQVIWNSGKVKSRETNHIPYTGAALMPSALYTWEVVVSTNQQKNIRPAQKATFETGLLDSGWSGAQWIMFDNSDSVFTPKKQTDKVVMFRSELEVNKQIKSAKIYTTSLGIHDLYINGKRVGHQQPNGETIYDELKPSWTDVRSTLYYLTYDVSPYLTQGTNAIAAQVASGWASGVIAHNRYKNPTPSYLAKVLITYTDGTSQTVVTNTEDWKSSIDGAIKMADIYAGEDYDARYGMDWTKPGFDDSGWHGVATNDYFKGNLTAHLGVPVRIRKDLNRKPQNVIIYQGINENDTDFGEINKVRELDNVSSFKLKKGETAILDFGQNLVGWSAIKIKGLRGSKLQIRYAEMLNDSGEESRGNDGAKGTLYRKNLRKARASVNYTLAGKPEGEVYRSSMTWFGFRYAEISADEDIEVLDVEAEVISSVSKEASSITTSHSDVNQLFQNTLWGMRGNFISVPLDCPQRNERMGWTGDTQVFAKTALYNSDLSAFYHKWMVDMRDGQWESGAFPTIAPQTWGSVGQGAAGWADAGIIVPYTVFHMTNDLGIIEENYDAMTRYMDFMSSQADSIYKYNGGQARFGDWLAYQETSKQYFSVCYYAYDALLMAEMAQAMGETDDADKYTALYENIKKEFNTRYVVAEGELSENTQSAYLFALKLDLFDSEKGRAQAISNLVKLIEENGHKLSTGFLGTAILNQTLSEIGQTDLAYNLLLQRDNPSWLYSIDQGATTIWERWNSYTIKDGFGDARMNSFNHYAYGVIVEWMYAYMAGIRSEGAGFRDIIIEPQLDLRTDLPVGQERITEVNAQYASVNGVIKSSWKVMDGLVKYQITIPANCTAKFIISRSLQDQPKKAKGVRSVKEMEGKTVVELGSGEYVFTGLLSADF